MIRVDGEVPIRKDRMESVHNTIENLLNEHDIARIFGLSVASVWRWRFRKGENYIIKISASASPGIGTSTCTTLSKGPHSSERILECLTTIEIITYRAVPLITFLIYAFKHIKAEWLAP